MIDISILRDGSGESATVEGNTDEGIEFVDSYVTPLSVLDSGRIVISELDLRKFFEAAQQAGLSVEVES